MRYVDLRSFYERFTPVCQRAISLGFEVFVGMGHKDLAPLHLFHGCIQCGDSSLEDALTGMGVPIESLNQALELRLNSLPTREQVDGEVVESTQPGNSHMLDGTTRAFHMSLDAAHRRGSERIGVADLAIGILRIEDDEVESILEEVGLAASLLIKGLTMLERGQNLDEKQFELPSYLKQFATNISQKIAMNKRSPIVGRKSEIKAVVEILSHLEQSNSAMLLGEAGVGKTALVEGLAACIANEDPIIPPRLRNRQVVELHLNSIVAGTMFRGMFEDRIDKILKELREHPEYILFIDEAHHLVGAGSAVGVPTDAANILKSALARGEIQIIGATTPTEYRRFIEEDEALARRFRTVNVDEPSVETTREILMGIREHIQDLYSVKISTGAIDYALMLSTRYKRGLKRPDKVISWLHTACVREEIAGRSKVRDDTILATVSDDVGIAAELLERNVESQLQTLQERLGNHVVAQHHALEKLSSRLRLNKGPLKENFMRPDGVFLFLGPTGVGKTEVAKALAEELFGDRNAMLRIDMSEFQAGGLSVDKLIGMPRGIVGSEMGGVLTTKVQQKPYSLILLDEIEKADRSVLNLFLQIFDEGWCTDGRGRKTYFSDTIIIMTSNLGSDSMRKLDQPLGFGGHLHVPEREVMQEAERFLSPELLNRIDDVVVFEPLGQVEVEEIARRYLRSIINRMEAEGRSLHVSEDAVRHLAAVGYNRKFGARPLKRTIDRLVKLPLTTMWHQAPAFSVTMDKETLIVGPELLTA